MTIEQTLQTLEAYCLLRNREELSRPSPFIIESVASDGTATATDRAPEELQTFAGVSVGEKVRIAGMGGTWTVKKLARGYPGVLCECDCSQHHTQWFSYMRIRRPSEDGQ